MNVHDDALESLTNNIVNTNKNSFLKKTLYIIFGILPASIFSLLSLLLMGGESFLVLIFIIASFCGTAGLYTITFSEEHDSKFEFILLAMGQLAMLIVIGFLMFNIVSSGNLSLDSILYLSLNKPHELIMSIIMLIVLLSPITIALHCQFTIYRRWRISRSETLIQ